jgi:hypothetical protein
VQVCGRDEYALRVGDNTKPSRQWKSLRSGWATIWLHTKRSAARLLGLPEHNGEHNGELPLQQPIGLTYKGLCDGLSMPLMTQW